MADITVCLYTPDRFQEWNSFVTHSNEGTIFHRLDFLAYHGERFRQREHHLMWHKGEELFGVMPMAIFKEEAGQIARSPYGASYGGPVFLKSVNYGDSRLVVTSLIQQMSRLNISCAILTLPIACCYAKYSETFRFALLEQGFRCVNRDISSVVSLNSKGPVSAQMTSRGRNMASKARRAGIVTVHQADASDFWMVMDKTFEKHCSKPTHTFQEFQWLQRHFPENVYVDVAYIDGRPIAGIGFFVINKLVNSTFYLCQDPEFQNLQAQSLLIYEAILRSQAENFSWFDFGTSSINMQARENIFRFKESFGAVGLFRETYRWERYPVAQESTQNEWCLMREVNNGRFTDEDF